MAGRSHWDQTRGGRVTGDRAGGLEDGDRIRSPCTPLRARVVVVRRAQRQKLELELATADQEAEMAGMITRVVTACRLISSSCSAVSSELDFGWMGTPTVGEHLLVVAEKIDRGLCPVPEKKS